MANKVYRVDKLIRSSKGGASQSVQAKAKSPKVQEPQPGRKPKVKAPRRPLPPSPSWIKPLDFEAMSKPAVPAPVPQVRVNLKGVPALAWQPLPHLDNSLLVRDLTLGARERLTDEGSVSMVEMVMGVDFGTSCTKVVISDRSTNVSYAVPFTDLVGVSAYLLPTQLGELSGRYCLEHEGHLHSDLKLSMLADLARPELNERVCAFLALVIRSARSWLFTQHAPQYKGKDLVWTLSLGQPADQSTSKDSRSHFEQLGRVAWDLAGAEGEPTVHSCAEAWLRAEDGDLDAGDGEVLVMPEIAAQIHGFVSSDYFDFAQRNLFLLIDVGAGTVDASLFRVVKKGRGVMDFEFFTSSVEANGAANLHRRRVAWWDAQLEPFDECRDVRQALEALRLPTEFRGAFPAKFSDYVQGVETAFEGGAKSPDELFFEKIRGQAVGRVLFRAWNDKYLTQQDLTGTPYFLCGGGAQHPLFERLQDALAHTPNATWLKAVRRELALPRGLRAEGLVLKDYHRLSVAYGLSKLNLGAVQQVSALVPVIPLEQMSDWRQDYVSKDAC
jgi:hypothetical protein